MNIKKIKDPSLLRRIENLEAESAKINGMLHTEIVQSDKLGYDFEVTKLGDAEVQRVYVPQENPVGTEDNPFTDRLVFVNNAFYLIDGKMFVYMNGEFIEW